MPRGVYKRPPPKFKSYAEYQRQWREDNKEWVKERNRKWRKAHPRACLKKHGLTVEDYERLLAKQGGRCAICGTSKPTGPSKKNFSVDHDHKTKKIRGLLCHGCNIGIGCLKDDPEVLRKAADYLSLHLQ